MALSLTMVDVHKLITYAEGGIFSKVITSGKMNVTLFCMAAGTDISEHTTTKEGFVYVIEGRGVFHINGEDVAMRPGAFIAVPNNAKHSLRAEENTAFLLSLS
jgi:quercetin dioxygenase-like cupin family protein